MKVKVEAQCGITEILTCEMQCKKTLNTGENRDFLILDGRMRDNLKLTRNVTQKIKTLTRRDRNKHGMPCELKEQTERCASESP